MFGKVIGGGMPVAAFGGKRDIMNCVAPLGPVYQAGTLSGNPVAVACGLATLHEIQQPGFYKRLSEQTAKLVKGLGAMAKKHGVAFSAQSIGGMFGIYFRGKCPPPSKKSWNAMPIASRLSSMPCSITVFIWLRAFTKPVSSPLPMTTPLSLARSKRLTRPLPKSNAYMVNLFS